MSVRRDAAAVFLSHTYNQKLIQHTAVEISGDLTAFTGLEFSKAHIFFFYFLFFLKYNSIQKFGFCSPRLQEKKGYCKKIEKKNYFLK